MMRRKTSLTDDQRDEKKSAAHEESLSSLKGVGETTEEATALTLVGGRGVLAAGRWLRTSGSVVASSSSAY